MLVWECVIAFRGHDCGSALIETSTHNKRTECLWQDFNVLVMCFAVLSNPKRNLVCSSDITNPLHFFVLRYVYLCRINAAIIDSLAGQRHGISTP